MPRGRTRDGRQTTPQRAGGRFLAVMALVTLAVACDKHTSDTSTSIPTTPTLPTVSVSSLEVSGPGSLAPGQSAQYTVIAHMSDSTTMEPTNVKWIGSPPEIVRVNESGYATAGGNGGAAVTAEIKVAGAQWGEMRGSKGVIVLPDGTLMMFGTVLDAEFSSAPLEGALVEVTPGSLSTTTNSDGFYRIYGVTPGAEARVTKTGYQPLVQAIGLTTHGRQDFGLALSSARLNLSGSYTLAIDAADGCSSLPAELQHRRYDAALTQTALMVNVTLTEPRFQLTLGRGNHFSGRVDGSTVTFALGPFDLGWDWGVPPTYPDVAERLSNGTFLVVDGTAVGTTSADDIVGTLNGSLTNMDAGYPTSATGLAGCGGKHRFTFTRR